MYVMIEASIAQFSGSGYWLKNLRAHPVNPLAHQAICFKS